MRTYNYPPLKVGEVYINPDGDHLTVREVDASNNNIWVDWSDSTGDSVSQYFIEPYDMICEALNTGILKRHEAS